MNKQKSAKRTNMRNVNSQRADEKNITKVFNIADLMRVQCTSVMVIFPLASIAHLFYFFQSVFSLFNSRGRLQWNPKYYRKMRTSRTSHFSMYRMHALQCILFIYFCIGELWKPFNWSTYTFRPIQLKDTMPKKEAQHAALNERKEKKNENDHYAFITMQWNTLKYSFEYLLQKAGAL